MKGIDLIGLIFFCIINMSAFSEQDLLRQLEQAKFDGNLREQTNILHKLGNHHTQTMQYVEATHFYQEAFTLSKERSNSRDQIFFSIELGKNYELIGDLSQALSLFQRGLHISQDDNDLQSESYLHNNIGNIYLKIGSFPQSLHHYQAALKIKQNLNDRKGTANAFMNLGALYIKTGDLKKSLEFHTNALQLFQQENDKNMMASVYTNIGIAHRRLTNYEQALEYYDKALSFYQEMDNRQKIASTYNNLGSLYQAKNDFVVAKDYFLNSYEMKKNMSDIQSLLITLKNLVDVSLNMEQTQDAVFYLEMAIGLAKGTQFNDLNRQLYKLRSIIDERKDDYEAALHNYKMYYAYSDSLFNENKLKLISEMQIQHEVLEKEKHIDLLEKNNELIQLDLKRSTQAKRYLITIIILIILIALTLIWRYLVTLKLNKKIESSRKELNTLNQELEKRVEQEVTIRQKQQEKAIRQSRLAILGEMAAGIAHEVNQPLQTLSATLENIMLSLENRQIDNDYIEEKLTFLFQDINRMQTTIDHIRRFTRQSDKSSYTTFCVNDSIRNVVDMVWDRFHKQALAIDLELEDNLPYLKGTPYKFEQVVINLLTNARDAITEKMEIETIVDSHILVKSAFEKDKIVVTVEDKGIGIPEKFQKKVFEIFFSTKKAEQGTGLGLTIVAGIIKSMEGTIHIQSKERIGTSVHVIFPCKKGIG